MIAATFCLLYIYRLRSRNLFQGITRPAFIAKTSAAPIAMVEEMPAFCNKVLSFCPKFMDYLEQVVGGHYYFQCQ